MGKLICVFVVCIMEWTGFVMMWLIEELTSLKGKWSVSICWCNWRYTSFRKYFGFRYIVIILSFRTERSEQTVETLIRLLSASAGAVWSGSTLLAIWIYYFMLKLRCSHLNRLMAKPTKWLCTQWRLRSAWASAQSDQSSLCTQWVAKDSSFLHADSEGSDQTGRMPRLIWVFAGRKVTLFCHVAAHLIITIFSGVQIFGIFFVLLSFKYLRFQMDEIMP